MGKETAVIFAEGQSQETQLPPPDERTRALGELPVGDFSKIIRGKTLVHDHSLEGRKTAIVIGTMAFGEEEEGGIDPGTNPIYKDLEGLDGLDVIVIINPRQHSPQLLVKGNGKRPTTCTYVNKAKVPDADGKLGQATAAQQIPLHLGLEPYKLYTLGFVNGTNELHIIEKKPKEEVPAAA